MKLIGIFLFCIAFVLAFSTVSFGQTTEELAKVGHLEGTLLVPSAGKAVPVLLIIAGSGPTDRNGNSPLNVNTNTYKWLAEGLAAEGLASLRYDKYGVGKSVAPGMKEDSLTFDQYIQHAGELVDYLSKDPRFSKVVIVGHSEGSLVGMVAANRRTVAAFISLAGAGRSIDEVINQQLAAQPEAIRNEVKAGLAALKAGDKIANPNPMLASLFRPSVQPYMISWLKYQPTVELAKLSIPVLIVQGTTDLQVAESEADRLRAALPTAQYLRLEGMNHVLKTAPASSTENLATYRQPELPLADGLVKGLVDFVKRLK